MERDSQQGTHAFSRKTTNNDPHNNDENIPPRPPAHPSCSGITPRCRSRHAPGVSPSPGLSGNGPAREIRATACWRRWDGCTCREGTYPPLWHLQGMLKNELELFYMCTARLFQIYCVIHIDDLREDNAENCTTCGLVTARRSTRWTSAESIRGNTEEGREIWIRRG
ncbi:MAG: hypothetical protein ACLT8E_00365 [Akkermansia sp.]